MIVRSTVTSKTPKYELLEALSETTAELEKQTAALQKEKAKRRELDESLRLSKNDRDYWRRMRRDSLTLAQDLEGKVAELQSEIDNAEFSIKEMEIANAREAATKEDAFRRSRNEVRRLQRQLEKPRLTTTQLDLLDVAQGVVPTALMDTTREIITDPVMRDTLMALMGRKDAMKPVTMLLAGIGMNQVARRHFDAALDKHWATGKSLKTLTREAVILNGQAREVVIGSGVHAAIWSAVRNNKGVRGVAGVRPIVLEKEARAGGSFAVSAGPSFYLNSRNRPGPLSVPGDEFGALNVLPGAPLQPSDLGGDEYLSNDALAWVTRMTLMMNADVYTGIDVAVTGYSSQAAVLASDYESFSTYAGQVVIATGLSSPRKAYPVTSDRYLTFSEFMKMMDNPFPLQGMRRVAVIGAGDGARTAVEALTGQGPRSALSVPTIDFVGKIDWYGCTNIASNRADWENCNRSRYKGIGRLLPDGEKPFRVMPLGVATYCETGYECVKLDGMPYDYVIDCSGYLMLDTTGIAGKSDYSYIDTKGGSRTLGRRYRAIWQIGPRAQLASEGSDVNVLRGVKENETAIFRYADRTARMAELFPA